MIKNKIDKTMPNENIEEEVIEGETPDNETESKDLDFLTKPIDEMTTEDAESLRKFALTQKAQKEHFKNKFSKTKEQPKKEDPEKINQSNTEQPNLTQEIDIRFLKRDGLNDEDIDQLKFIQAGLKAQGKDVSLMEAQQHDLYKSYETNKSLTEKRVKAQLISSGGGNFSKEKEMSEEEFEEMRKQKADAILSRM